MKSITYSKDQATTAPSQMGQSKFEILLNKMNARLKEASEAFFARLTWENENLAQATKAPQDVSLNLAGYLFSNSNEKTLPVYEGLNHWTMDENQNIQIFPGVNANTNQENILSLEYDFLQIYDKNAASKKQTLSTNESIRLGNKIYFIKILPKKYRVKKSMTLEVKND